VVIYQFNRLIRNRFLWGAFAAIIAFAFVSVDSCSTSGSDGSVAGKLGRKKVSSQAFRDMEHYIRQTSQSEAMTPALLYTQTWERVAAAYTADKLGLSVSPELIRQEILSAEAFSNGFDVNYYRMMIRQNLNMSEREFEAGLANNILLRMLSQTVSSAAWVSPMEMDDTIATYTDNFSAQHAVVSNIFANADIEVTEKDMLTYYEEHRQEYALPDRVSVSYVAIPITNYIATVAVEDADIVDYYDSNPQLFTRPGTDADANITEDVDGRFITNPPPETVAMTLAEARPTIIENLKQQLAADVAWNDVCHTLIEEAVTSNSLAGVAATLGLEVKNTPLFAVDDYLPGIENATEMREKAFELDHTRVTTSFNAVLGTTVVYLIAALSNDVARIPALNEVAREVRDATTAELRFKQYDAHIKELYAKVTAAIEDGADFADAAASAGLTATTNYNFTISQGLPSGIPEINTVIPEVLKLTTGAVAASKTPRFGHAVIVKLVERTPGDAMSATFMRSQLRDSVERRLFPALFADWLAWNLKQNRFKPTPGTEPVSYDDSDNY